MIRTFTPSETNEESEHAWSLSFGDLMSLLLAVFVLIAAMSDLREGERFETVSRSVRAAFGFTLAGAQAAPSNPESVPPLLARFEAMGMSGHKPMLAIDEMSRVAQCCSIHQEGDRLIVRLIGEDVFKEHSAILQPMGHRLVDWLADYLQAGSLSLEIRGLHGVQPLPEHASYADGRDLAFARARQVADLLSASGLEENRMMISTFGASALRDATIDDHNALRVEIIVHALPTASHDNNFAGELGS